MLVGNNYVEVLVEKVTLISEVRFCLGLQFNIIFVIYWSQKIQIWAPGWRRSRMKSSSYHV